MTYVSELNAQFAKEAMACQSMDNDEILNVRWATEDPNPTSKIQEQARLEEMGKKAIQERMDPRIVDAMRAVRALEEGIPLENEDEEGEDSATHSEYSVGDDEDDETYKAQKPHGDVSITKTRSLKPWSKEELNAFADYMRKHPLPEGRRHGAFWNRFAEEVCSFGIFVPATSFS